MPAFQQLFSTTIIIFIFLTTQCYSLRPLGHQPVAKVEGIPDNFRLLNRSTLVRCPDPNPYLGIDISTKGPIHDHEENITITVHGVLFPSKSDWVALISPPLEDAFNSLNDCPLDAFMYQQTGDFSQLPLICRYPVKAQYLSNDPDYLGCKKRVCQVQVGSACIVRTCNASITFHVVNIRTQIEFVMFGGGFETPCLHRRSQALNFSNPNMPVYAHLSSIDSSAESMRITWVSGDNTSQQVEYGNGMSASSMVSTFTRDDMCSGGLPSPAKKFGWHDPGYIHSAVMTGLEPSHSYSYRYGSNSAGWSRPTDFRTPPAGGSNKDLMFIAFGDMGKAPLDLSIEHYIQPGSLSVIAAIADEVASGRVHSIFHIGDISYATGFLVEWDYFLHLINPVASHVPYMTAIGNHERDYIGSGAVYITPDSGGECGVPYETYFQMPISAKDKPWYSIEQAGVHFTVISTEHSWTKDSTQYQWIEKDLASVNRTRTPWIIFMGHRPMYSSSSGSALPSVDSRFTDSMEPLLFQYQVNLVLSGHVHSYERTCALYEYACKAMPSKDSNGIGTYDHSNYTAPIHAIIGMAGFTLDQFPPNASNWSLVRISEFGFARFNATTEQLKVEFVDSTTRTVIDGFKILKK